MDVDDLSPALRVRLGADATQGLLAVFDATRHEWAAEVIAVALDRSEKHLREEFDALRTEIRVRDHAAAREEAAALASTLRHEMSALRVELLKRSLFCVVWQTVAIAAALSCVLMFSG